VIKSLSSLPYSDDVSVIRKQIIRSSTSVAANYRAASRARSEKMIHLKSECEELVKVMTKYKFRLSQL
jgi:hypothetical protein